MRGKNSKKARQEVTKLQILSPYSADKSLLKTKKKRANLVATSSQVHPCSLASSYYSQKRPNFFVLAVHKELLLSPLLPLALFTSQFSSPSVANFTRSRIRDPYIARQPPCPPPRFLFLSLWNQGGCQDSSRIGVGSPSHWYESKKQGQGGKRRESEVPPLLPVASLVARGRGKPSCFFSLVARGRGKRERRWARWSWLGTAWTRRCGPASAWTLHAARFCASSRCVSPQEGSVVCLLAVRRVLGLLVPSSRLYQDSGMTE